MGNILKFLSPSNRPSTRQSGNMPRVPSSGAISMRTIRKDGGDSDNEDAQSSGSETPNMPLVSYITMQERSRARPPMPAFSMENIGTDAIPFLDEEAPSLDAMLSNPVEDNTMLVTSAIPGRKQYKVTFQNLASTSYEPNGKLAKAFDALNLPYTELAKICLKKEDSEGVRESFTLKTDDIRAYVDDRSKCNSETCTALKKLLRKLDKYKITRLQVKKLDEKQGFAEVIMNNLLYSLSYHHHPKQTHPSPSIVNSVDGGAIVPHIILSSSEHKVIEFGSKSDAPLNLDILPKDIQKQMAYVFSQRCVVNDPDHNPTNLVAVFKGNALPEEYKGKTFTQIVTDPEVSTKHPDLLEKFEIMIIDTGNTGTVNNEGWLANVSSLAWKQWGNNVLESAFAPSLKDVTPKHHRYYKGLLTAGSDDDGSNSFLVTELRGRAKELHSITDEHIHAIIKESFGEVDPAIYPKSFENLCHNLCGNLEYDAKLSSGIDVTGIRKQVDNFLGTAPTGQDKPKAQDLLFTILKPMIKARAIQLDWKAGLLDIQNQVSVLKSHPSNPEIDFDDLESKHPKLKEAIDKVDAFRTEHKIKLGDLYWCSTPSHRSATSITTFLPQSILDIASTSSKVLSSFAKYHQMSKTVTNMFDATKEYASGLLPSPITSRKNTDDVTIAS